MRNGQAGFLALALCSALASERAIAGDFVYGDDFDSAPVCAADAFAISASPSTQSALLGSQSYYYVKVRSCDTSAGNSLAASGVPTNWTVTFDPTSVTPAANSTAVALMKIAVATNGDAGVHAIDVSAQSAAATVHASPSLDVTNMYIITIPDGSGSGDHHIGGTLYLRVGATLRMFNADTTSNHLIHAGLVPGFQHEYVGGPGISAGQYYDLTSTSSGTDMVYCHLHGGGTITVHVDP